MPNVVDDRVFVLGLNELFRAEKQEYETAVLLPHAERLVAALRLPLLDVPVEGYYYQSEDLRRYFLLIRTLQNAEKQPMPDAAAETALERLRAVYSSPAMGRPCPDLLSLLPRTGSPLGDAMESLGDAASWNVERISRRAAECVTEDDANLVAVAAVTGDPVLLCATRETMALEMALPRCAVERPAYEWAVSPPVAAVARRFIAALERDTGITLPPAMESSAEIYWNWAQHSHLDGRCIAIGEIFGDHYHWYIAHDGEKWTVVDFWSKHLWTTEGMIHTPHEHRPAIGSRAGAPTTPPLPDETAAHTPQEAGLMTKIKRLLTGKSDE